jgi:hypothetical protein
MKLRESEVQQQREMGLLRKIPAEETGTPVPQWSVCPVQLKGLFRTAWGPMRRIPETPEEPSFAGVV